ncbi:uncharacterized protein LOC121251158 [Juglans microcarpa x Juglans regia]|uniref:uncharacterized protein LOC121251158 n=1 Tax=Juglans microcarpa x Juglans regia TaxID=2249226 RepID=UPI001B7E7549|nr:uncharacterized protein LOC121251158 [Juglans microcarpa x Juglans regia]
MKREGRQHGMVRTYRILPSSVNPRPETRFINKFDSPPTAGLFTKVPSKPTNHSKFTGKCATPRCTGCHVHPTSKSKLKAKGAQKLKSNDVMINSRFVSWRVVDGQPGLNFSSISATDLMDHLSSDYMNDDEVSDLDDEHNESVDLTSTNRGNDNVEVDTKNNNEEKHVIDDDEMSFCDVGLRLDRVEEEEGWCLVEEW